MHGALYHQSRRPIRPAWLSANTDAGACRAKQKSSKPYGVDRNPQMAQKYFERAGEAGFAAGFRMAGEIALGNNERDRGMALIQRATEAGDADAQFRMSAMLANAARSPAEMQAATGWLNRAATAGHALAAEQLGANPRMRRSASSGLRARRRLASRRRCSGLCSQARRCDAGYGGRYI